MQLNACPAYPYWSRLSQLRWGSFIAGERCLYCRTRLTMVANIGRFGRCNVANDLMGWSLLMVAYLQVRWYGVDYMRSLLMDELTRYLVRFHYFYAANSNESSCGRTFANFASHVFSLEMRECPSAAVKDVHWTTSTVQVRSNRRFCVLQPKSGSTRSRVLGHS